MLNTKLHCYKLSAKDTCFDSSLKSEQRTRDASQEERMERVRAAHLDLLQGAER